MEEKLLAALKITKGCLHPNTSLEVWDLIEALLEEAEAKGLGQDNAQLPANIQTLLSQSQNE